MNLSSFVNGLLRNRQIFIQMLLDILNWFALFLLEHKRFRSNEQKIKVNFSCSIFYKNIYFILHSFLLVFCIFVLSKYMIQKAFQKYINNFRGFSREIWILTFVTFINRAGTMVFAFFILNT